MRAARWWPLAVGSALLPAQDGPSPAFLQRYCLECHDTETQKGRLDLSVAPADPVAALWRWSRLRERLAGGDMPPPDAEAPSPAERAALVAAADAALREGVPRLPADPGRVTVRRLSRTQWENTVRAVFGATVAAVDFPADDLGYGFDTIGDALTFATLHLEKHLAAAAAVAEQVFHGEDPARPAVRRFEAEAMRIASGPATDQSGEIAHMITNAEVEQDVRLPRDGVYRLRLAAGADPAGDEPARMVLRFDGKDLDSFDVERREPAVFTVTAALLGGAHRFGIAFVNDFYAPEHPDPRRRDRNLRADWLEIEGPLDPRPVPEAQRWVAAAVPADGPPAQRLTAFARELLPRAWRRPVADDEVARLAAVGEAALADGEPWLAALRAVVQAALCSPHFLFRLEPGTGAGPVPPHALAARLSYFVWSSAPDARLQDLAAGGQLAAPAVLEAEVRRLLADPRAEALATDFAAQWFELRGLWERTPDPARFPGFDDGLRQSLRRETELLFLAVLRLGLDVRRLLDAPFTHVDARLAAFYGLPAPAGEGFQRVLLPPAQAERGGLLGHASVLAVTSNPTRTSPVKRGKWILEHLLGQPPPPPQPGNDSLAGEGAERDAATLRQQLAAHRERSECAGCHVRMDPLGLALERYDAIGRHRLADAGGPIDCTGELPGGRTLQGLASLKRELAADPAFVRTAARKLFTYAMGREPRPIDRLRLDHAVDARLAAGPVGLADLVLLVATGEWFTHRSAAP